MSEIIRKSVKAITANAGASIPGFFVGALFYVALFIYFRRKFAHKCPLDACNVVELAFFSYTGAILAVTGMFSLDFSTFEGFSQAVNHKLVPYIGSPYFDVVLNVILFVPFGYLLKLEFPKAVTLKNVFKAAFMLSFCVEFIQFFGGRYTETEDVINNTLGALIGYELYYCTLGEKFTTAQKKQRLISIAKLLGIFFVVTWIVSDHTDGIRALSKIFT